LFLKTAFKYPPAELFAPFSGGRFRFVAFTYGFHSLHARLQKAAFYSVKGRLSEGKKPCIEG
jgi:hypothetical protein